MAAASLASAIKTQKVQLEVETRLMGMAKDIMQEQGDALLKLIDSTRAIELLIHPHLGSKLDLRG